MTNGVNLVASTHYPAANNGTNVTKTNLNIVNVQPLDTLTYGLRVVHPAGTVTQFVNLTTVGALTPASRTNLAGTRGFLNRPRHRSCDRLPVEEERG